MQVAVKMLLLGCLEARKPAKPVKISCPAIKGCWEARKDNREDWRKIWQFLLFTRPICAFLPSQNLSDIVRQKNPLQINSLVHCYRSVVIAYQLSVINYYPRKESKQIEHPAQLSILDLKPSNYQHSVLWTKSWGWIFYNFEVFYSN